MKRILTAIFLIVACAGSCFAADVGTENAQQKITNEKSYTCINFQKAPDTACGKQAITNKGSWFNINIIINGKQIHADTAAVKSAK